MESHGCGGMVAPKHAVIVRRDMFPVHFHYVNLISGPKELTVYQAISYFHLHITSKCGAPHCSQGINQRIISAYCDDTCVSRQQLSE